MKLSDYLAWYLVNQNVKKIFLLTGGAAAHIVDSLGRNPDIEYICVQHEQAAAMAADAYSRVTGNLGVAVATSGPGATNLITGVCCSFFDSVPVLMITGQVNLWETKGSKKARQIGFQETDIIDIVRPITKFAVMVEDPEKIKYYLDKAIYIAKTGRPGPVWLDIPMNVQHAEINPERLEGFDPIEADPEYDNYYQDQIPEIVNSILSAKRPVILAGSGLRISRAENEFAELLNLLRAPVVSTWTGIDLLPYGHPLYIGQIGVYGNRAANFAIQNSDLLLSLGSRLDTRQTGSQPKTFAREAKKIVVDISRAELTKEWVIPDLPVNADAGEFLELLNPNLAEAEIPDFSEWLQTCHNWKKRYPAMLPEYRDQKNSVNPYVFMDALSEKMKFNSTIVVDNGGISAWAMQGIKVKEGHRVLSSFGHAPMGYALPAGIGAYAADPARNIICIIGDGGIQLTIQDLQTIKNYNLPIKLFILNNNAYGIIKQFQEIYFGARYEATVNKTGYSAPDFIKIAEAYGIEAVKICDHDELEQKLEHVLNLSEPVICDVRMDEFQKLIPKLIAIRTPDGKYISKPLEDMAPLLPRDEFTSNMIVSPLPEGDKKEESDEAN